MKKRRIIVGTVLAAAALCWALWGGTAKADVVPAATTERAVSAPCALQTQPTEPINKIDISEPVTESETIPVAGSVDSPKWKCPQETPMVIPASTPAKEPIAKSPAEETPQPHDGMVYVPGFGWLQSEVAGEWSVSENMHESGNKIGSMG